MSKCKCSMSISMLGDGCRYCQPQQYIDKLAEWLEESRAEATTLEAECERLRASLNDAAKAMHWVQANTPMSKRISASLAKARIAAELSALSANPGPSHPPT